MTDQTYIGERRWSSGEAKALLKKWRGKTVRNTKTGALFIVGEPFGTSDWWLMQLDPPAKAHFNVRELAHQLEPVNE